MTDSHPAIAERRRALDRRGAWWVLAALHLAGAAAVAVEFLRPADAALEPTPEGSPLLAFVGSFAAFGFVACVALVLLGRELRRLVARRPDYFDRTSPGDGPDRR